MILKIKKINTNANNMIAHMLITIIIIMQYKFFFLPDDFSSIIMRFNTDYSSVSIIIVGILTFILFSVFNNFKIKLGYFSKMIIALLMYILLVFIYTLLKYPSLNISRSISTYSYILVLVLYFVLYEFFSKYDGFDYFIKLITICNIILAILMILAAFQYNKTGEIFLTIYELKDGLKFHRNGMIRIYAASGVIITSAVISIGLLFSNYKNKILHVINIGISVIQIYYVTQTRMSLIVVMLIILIGILMVKTKKIAMKCFVLISGCLGAIYILLTKISFSFTEYSFVTRLDAYKYFLVEGLTNFFGIGMLTNSDVFYWNVLHGETGVMSISDIGVIGVLGNFGIMAFVWYLYIILKMMNLKFGKYNVLRMCVVGFLLFSAPTMAPFGYGNIFFIPVSMAIVEHLHKKETINMEI